MQADMSAEQVVTQIQQLNQNGDTLNKKKVKQSNPELMKNALYYYPSWEHALQASGITQ
ncbi:MAG: hypothetical protein ACXVOI_09745 [Tumebacillaceae bacterium]